MPYDTISAEQATRISAWIAERQYGDDAIKQGLAYADENGGSSDAEVTTLAMSRILYSADQLKHGAVFAVKSLEE